MPFLEDGKAERAGAWAKAIAALIGQHEDTRKLVAREGLWYVPLRSKQPRLAEFRFVSEECEARKPREFRREHVIPRVVLEQELAAATTEAQVREILMKTEVCAVSVQEERRLPRDGAVVGWDRYRRAGVVVIDRKTGKKTT
jgi:2-polyprenyl-6-methoxyphenol hydroxylase-like FAD-dependent oxidoreductase